MTSRFAEFLLRVWLSAQWWRRAEPTREDFDRELWRTNSRRMGLRFTERLRDRFRRTWMWLVNRGDAG